MRKLFDICTLAVAASAMMAPAAEASISRPITSGTVIGNCGGDLQFGIPGTYG
jgi:mannose/fructose/N-acetylgalactosamine-specific phosphotransferase system component IIC